MEYRSPVNFDDSKYRCHSSGSTHVMPELSFSSPRPLPIAPRSIMHTVPPPLPPPARIHDLEMGYDAGWRHANSQSSTSLPPINPGSSLLGGHPQSESDSQGDPMQIDEMNGKPNDGLVSRSPKTQNSHDPLPSVTEGFPNAMPGNPNPSGSM